MERNIRREDLQDPQEMEDVAELDCYRVESETWGYDLGKRKESKRSIIWLSASQTNWPPGSQTVTGSFQYLNIPLNADATLGKLLRLFPSFDSL